MISCYSEPTKRHFRVPQGIISLYGCQFGCRLNLCPARAVFLLAEVRMSKTLQISRSPIGANTKSHQVRFSVTRPPLNSTRRCSDLLPPRLQLYECRLKTPQALAPPFSSLLSNYPRLETSEESGLIRSFLFYL